jgi:spectinomycin phosphotransferase
VRDRPDGFGERELRLALAEGWQIRPVATRYAPVGGGSYHWVVRDDRGERWFATVDDLDVKAWLGDTRMMALAGLRRAMNTALALRRQAGLPFVLAPEPTSGGDTVRPAGVRHGVAVFRFACQPAGQFGQALSGSGRNELTDMLAALHRATPVVAAGAPVAAIGLPLRETLEAALGELSRPWPGGPFAEPARALLAGTAQQIGQLLLAFDQMAGAVAAREQVISHGEPHPGNILGTGRQRLLIDWDTVGLAPPERDLWMVADPAGHQVRRYTRLTGRAVDPAVLAWYRLRWALDDISAFVHQLRSGHRRTADAEHAWRSLRDTVMRAIREPPVTETG